MAAAVGDGAAEVGRFLSHLAIARDIAPATQRLALKAIVFLCKRVLEKEHGPVGATPAARPRRLPAVQDAVEVRAVLDALPNPPGLTGQLERSVRSMRGERSSARWTGGGSV